MSARFTVPAGRPPAGSAAPRPRVTTTLSLSRGGVPVHRSGPGYSPFPGPGAKPSRRWSSRFPPCLRGGGAPLHWSVLIAIAAIIAAVLPADARTCLPDADAVFAAHHHGHVHATYRGTGDHKCWFARGHRGRHSRVAMHGPDRNAGPAAPERPPARVFRTVTLPMASQDGPATFDQRFAAVRLDSSAAATRISQIFSGPAARIGDAFAAAGWR